MKRFSIIIATAAICAAAAPGAAFGAANPVHANCAGGLFSSGLASGSYISDYAKQGGLRLGPTVRTNCTYY